MIMAFMEYTTDQIGDKFALEQASSISGEPLIPMYVRDEGDQM